MRILAIPFLALSLAGCSAGAKVDWAGVSMYLKEQTSFDSLCAKRHQAYQLFHSVRAVVPDKISPLAVTRVDQAYAVANAVCEAGKPEDLTAAVDRVNLALSVIAREVADARAKANLPQ